MDYSETIKVLEGNVLERIRQRPPLFLGSHSLSALRHFLTGYGLAFGELGAPSPNLIPNDFHDWVAYRLHFRESTSGYADMILERTPDEAQALQRFFELLDEHRARAARIVARVRRHPPDFKITKVSVSQDGEISRGAEIPHAEEVSIVVFTDDPGFFVINNDLSFDHPWRSAFYPSLSWLHKPYRADVEFTTILDGEQFGRLRREEADFEQTLHEENTVRQRKLKQQAGGID